VPPTNAISVQALLASHWVPEWGFRDELNVNDTDYQNFWTDNAGKIAMAGMLANDTADADRALGFISNHLSGYYLPEVVVNSSMFRPWMRFGNVSLSNRIALLWGSNQSNSRLEQLSLGDYYAGSWLDGFLGADRIWWGGGAHRANSSVVMVKPDGFIGRAFFSFGGLGFYTYLNVTLSIGNPFVNVSLQVQPLNSTFGPQDYIYLQDFAPPSPYSFENATLFNGDGVSMGSLPFRNGHQVEGSGLLVAYSNRTSTLDEHGAAINFTGGLVYDAEHYYNDSAFDGLSWFGIGYRVPQVELGELSVPVYATAYPIQHLDYRLLSDTVKYLHSAPANSVVSSPVSFGFIAEGLALEAKAHPNDAALAEGYWNFYYDRYVGTQGNTAYHRAVNVFALAGFELYGCNSTVEAFTRAFVESSSGSSIEEYGWASAALHRLYECTGSSSDYAQYQSVTGSFVPSKSYFEVLNFGGVKPTWTFQFGEAASGLLIGGVPFNSQSLVLAMDAVFQSNVSGVLRNQPYNGDLANTETIPAYTLATWLFQNAMKTGTGYWITSLRNANVTSISYVRGGLSIRVAGDDGSLCLGTPSGTTVCNYVSGKETLSYPIAVVFWYWPSPLVAIVLAAMVLVVMVLAVIRNARKRPRERCSIASDVQPPKEQRCRNGHPVHREGEGFPTFCPTCGIRLSAAHPLLLGVLTGFGASILVSALELSMLSYAINTNSTLGLVILVGAIPLVFVFSGGIGAAYLRLRYGNMNGLGQVLLGTFPVVILFTILWGAFLLLAAMMISCGTGFC
jgi:hypothetical protein